MEQKPKNMKVHVADGSTRSSSHCLKETYVRVEEHNEYLDFHVMKLPKYDAILGKYWLDR